MNHPITDARLRKNITCERFLCCYLKSMTLADLRRENPELFPKELCAWAEHYEFFTNEYAGGEYSRRRKTTDEEASLFDTPKAVVVAMVMVEAIRRCADCDLLGGAYFRTSSAISSRAIVVVRCTPDKKIEIESWAKSNRHQLLADWDWDMQGSL